MNQLKQKGSTNQWWSTRHIYKTQYAITQHNWSDEERKRGREERNICFLASLFISVSFVWQRLKCTRAEAKVLQFTEHDASTVTFNKKVNAYTKVVKWQWCVRVTLPIFIINGKMRSNSIWQLCVSVCVNVLLYVQLQNADEALIVGKLRELVHFTSGVDTTILILVFYFIDDNTHAFIRNWGVAKRWTFLYAEQSEWVLRETNTGFNAHSQRWNIWSNQIKETTILNAWHTMPYDYTSLQILMITHRPLA